MRVICPHAGPVPAETRAALDASGCPWEPADVSATDTSYTRLLACLWAAGETFAIVEHDIIPPAGALPALAYCPRPWCAYSYPYMGGAHAGLGCARFSASLLATVPGAVTATWEEADDAHPPGHWCRLDHRLSRVLRRAGFRQHVHQPPAGHLNPVPSHGCA